MIKMLAMTLSRSAAELLARAAASPPPSSALLADCALLISQLSSAIDAACSLIPCDALSTLADTRRALGAALLARMGVAGPRRGRGGRACINKHKYLQ
jgi:hypothetical protein